MHKRRLATVVAAVGLHAACMNTPPPKLPAAPVVPERQKQAWILQLEDQRLLRIEPPPAPPPPPIVKGRKPAAVVPPPAPSSSPDLAVLVRDPDARLRRRAALAIGRVKERAGTALLVPALADADADVRAMAAFALGLIGDATVEASLAPLLDDAAPIVRGRAAEALGLIGAKGAAAAIGRMAAGYARSAAVAAMTPDDETRPAPPEAEAFKLGLFALVRLSAYDPLAAAVVNDGQPVSAWWPIAYALQRVDDPRAAPALLGTARRAPASTRVRLRRAGSAAPSTRRRSSRCSRCSSRRQRRRSKWSRRRCARSARSERPRLRRRWPAWPCEPATDANLRLEAVAALGELHAPDGVPILQDLMTDEWPAMRAAALRAVAAVDPESFPAVLASLAPDTHWRVRAALADTLGALPAAVAGDRLRSMLQDDDKRVLPAVIAALARMKADGARTAARRAPGRRGLLGARRGRQRDWDVEAGRRRRGAAAGVQESAARPALQRRARRRSKRWRPMAPPRPPRPSATRSATRIGRCACGRRSCSRKLDPSAAAPAIAPAPGPPQGPYDDETLIAPGTSPHVFIETAYGTIEFELAVLDAPQTSRNFVELVKKGFFNGLEVHRVVANFVVQDGDPRGDGGGGPGYTIRDELNERPYLRGTVGMALEWRDTGGSQFFITHSPQPHLDGEVHGVRPRGERHGDRRSDQAGRRDSADSRVERELVAGLTGACGGICTVHRAEHGAPLSSG